MAVNPYRAPDAPVAENFILVEPVKRPMSNFVAAVSCFAFAIFMLTIEGFFIWVDIDRWSKAGTKFENLPAHFGWRDLILVPIGFSTLAFLLSGWSFWTRRDRPGAILFLVAIGMMAATFLLPFLFP